VVVVRCDVHRLDDRLRGVADGPFAVTRADGGFVNPGLRRPLPVTAGTSASGEKTVEVVVPAEGAAAADLLYGK